jgi:hypothetical protein
MKGWNFERCISMKRRHLVLSEEDKFCLPAIDDIISRGLWEDWREMHEAIKRDRTLLDDIKHICKHNFDSPSFQRYYFWYNYVQKHKAAS